MLSRLLAVPRLASASARAFRTSSLLGNKHILIADPISDDCVRVFQEAGYTVTRLDKVPKEPELCAMINHYDGLVVRSGCQVTEKVRTCAFLPMRTAFAHRQTIGC